MPRFDTSLGRSVPHCHIGETPQCKPVNMTAAERQQARDWLARNFPKVVEVRAPSWAYNCHGYACASAHGWFDEPELFLEDDFFDVPFHKARKGDVVIYMNGEERTHSGIVHEVKNRRIRKVRSKWGPYAAVIHRPNDVHDSYGEAARLVRRRRRRPNA